MKFRSFANNKKVTGVTLGVGAALIVLGIILKKYGIFTMENENGLTLYLSQLSFTFITISVMSVLSDSSVVIYWENIVKKKLIEPVWTCFHSYTTYSFATVIFGGIAALIDLPIIFLAFFVIDIFVLMALTFSMIDVYFNHDEKAARLENEFRALVSDTEGTTEHLKANYEKYLKITSKLRTNTILALRAYDSPTIEENFRFYARNAAYIPRRDFETIMKCVDEINISDYTEWFDYYSSISYTDNEMPEYKAQPYIENIMCKNFDLFSFVFNSHILVLFAKASDSVSAEIIFGAYKEFMKNQRDTLKITLKEDYDRRRMSPAVSYSRDLLLKALVEVMKMGDRKFLMSFLHVFEETNMLSNYDYEESDVYVWEDYFKTIPEAEAEDILYDIYPITEIMYGTHYPQCVKEAVGFAWGDFDNFVSHFTISGERFSKGDVDETYEEENPSEGDIDEWEYYCNLYGQKYIGWPPENDKCGYFTYAGSRAYATSEEYGEMLDGDLQEKP